ncbi:MAG: O-antigen ligase family protein [Anaerolineae bacterium]
MPDRIASHRVGGASTFGPRVPVRATLAVLGVIVRLAILLGLVAVTAQDVVAYRLRNRGVESGLATDLPVLESPRTGIAVALEQYETNLDLLDALNTARDLGYGTLVQHFSWASMEPARGEYEWDPWDDTLTLVQAEGFQIVAVLDGAPAWARAAHEADNPLAPPDTPADYARFAAAFAGRYGDRIRAYQIWDEPNIYPHWGKGAIDPAGYVLLLEAASSAIHDVHPNALIVAGGMAPNTERSGRNMSDLQFLREIYRLGGSEWFDVLGVKAYGFWSGPYDRRVDSDLLNFSRVILLREEMVARGDGAKPIWSLDGGWAALPTDWDGDPSPLGSDSAELQASRLKDAFARTGREWPWMTLFGALHLQPAAGADDPVWGLSLLDPAGQPQALMLALGSGLRGTDVYSTGRHRVSSPLLPGALSPTEERAVAITFYGTDLAVALDSEQAQGALRVLAPYDRTVSLDAGTGHSGLYWLVRRAPAQEHTVTLVGIASQIGAIQGLQVGVRPDSIVLWTTIIASLLLAVWLANGVAQHMRLIDWRMPYRWARRCAQRLPETWSLAGLALLFALAMAAPGSMVRLGLLALYGFSVLLRPDVALFVAVASIPLAPVHVGLGPGSFSTTELAVLCAVLARAGAAVLGGERLWPVRFERLQPADLLILAFVAWTGIGALHAEYQREALREFRTAVAEPALLYLLLRLTGDNQRLWQRLVQALYASAVGTALYALWRYPLPQGAIEAEGVRRARGYFGSPNNLALYLERLLPLGASVASEPGPRRRRWAYAAGAAILLVVIILTFSRGAWLLGVPAGLLVVGLLKGKRARRYTLMALAVLAACLVPLMQTERFASLLDLQGGTSFLRLRLWEASWAMVKDHPWTGVGLDNFLYYYGDYILPGAEVERWLSHPHNIVLDLLVRTGLPGLLLFLSAVLAVAVPAVRRWRVQASESRAILAGLLGGLAAMMAHGLIDNAFFVPELAYWTMFVLGYLAVATRPQAGGSEQPSEG